MCCHACVSSGLVTEHSVMDSIYTEDDVAFVFQNLSQVWEAELVAPASAGSGSADVGGVSSSPRSSGPSSGDASSGDGHASAGHSDAVPRSGLDAKEDLRVRNRL